MRPNGVLPKRRKLLSEVPQGSVLSPLLFVIYPVGVKNNGINKTLLFMYADDIALQCTECKEYARNMEEIW